jgi:hypothetical protein
MTQQEANQLCKSIMKSIISAQIHNTDKVLKQLVNKPYQAFNFNINNVQKTTINLNQEQHPLQARTKFPQSTKKHLQTNQSQMRYLPNQLPLQLLPYNKTITSFNAIIT